MGRSCCVPGCNSNYRNTASTSAFKFPKDKALREKWIRSIHRSDFDEVVNDNSVVCIHHFEKSVVIWEDIYPVKDGDPIRVPRKYPKLTSDAYPTLFPNLPFYISTTAPKPRRNPEERVEQQLQRDEENFQRWCEHDRIINFESFSSEVMKRNLGYFYGIVRNNHVLFLKVEDDDVPSITVSFKVSHTLEISVYHKNVCLPTESFRWILETEGQEDLKCDRWTKFDSLISHLNGYKESNVGFNNRVVVLTNALKDAIVLYGDSNKERLNKIKFALEQLELSVTQKVRYSAELLIWAATFSYSYPGAYQLLRNTKVMTLPHHVYLRQILTKIGPNTPGLGPSQKAFLKEKTKLLQNNDKVVSVMLDEVHVNSKLSYKAGKILGMADNCSELDPACTMQVFMASSLHSKQKDVISLFPVKKMTADTLLKLTLEVLKVMNELQFEVICLVSDNHSTNRKMFELLSGGSLKPSIPNPYNSSKPLFLLFDNVHLLKCLRNNWLNKVHGILTVPNVEETFKVIEDMSKLSEGTVTCEYTIVEAKFSDLRDLFHSEKNMLLKLAPHLSRKALYPTSIERQNVALAVAIFHEKNIVALEMLQSQGVNISEGTIQFLKLFSKWWTICNVQHPLKGKYSQNEDANPISGPEDSKLVFLQNLKTYIDIWHMSDSQGKLSKETYIAMTHTLSSLVELCKYILRTYKWSYVLTAKLQTDSLEGRFGAYRRLSGCTYNVSVEQILESERKLKVLSVLKLKSAKHGEFILSDFASEVYKSSKQQISENLDHLEPAVEEVDSITITADTQKILVCIASYTSMKVIEKLRKRNNCVSCVEMLQTDEEIFILCETEEILSYFSKLNRGGLKCPSPIMLSLCSDTYRLFQVLINSAYESEFLKLGNQRDAVVTLGKQLIENTIGNLDDICKCGVVLRTIVKKSIKILANILINNYTKLLNDRNVTKELSRKIDKRCKRNLSEVDSRLTEQRRKELKLSSK